MIRTAAPRRDEKTGTWWFVVDLPPGPEGERRQARRRGFPTRKAAQDKIRVNAREGTVVEPSRVTVAEYLRTWLDTRATGGLGKGNVASYRWMIERKVVPHVRGVRLQGWQPAHLDALYARLLAEGLTPRTTRYAHTIVRVAIELPSSSDACW